MIKIRLRRLGKKKQPIYKIVAADSRSPRDGKFLEAIGNYNPMVQPMLVNLKEDRLFLWLKRGAQPTETVRGLLSRKGLWLKWSLVRKGADADTIAAALEKWQSLQAEKLNREAQKKARRKAARKSKAAAAQSGTQPAQTESQTV